MQISKFSTQPSKQDLMWFLSLDDKAAQQVLYTKALEARDQTVGNKVYLRGLIEYSNICYKDCYYCGIRSSNDHKQPYTISHDEVIEAARFAHDQQYGSIVIQTGEQQSSHFVN